MFSEISIHYPISKTPLNKLKNTLDLILGLITIQQKRVSVVL